MYQDQFTSSFNDAASAQNPESAPIAPSSNNSLRLSLSTDAEAPSTPAPCSGKEALLPLPAHWFRTDKPQLLQELGHLSKAALVEALALLLEQGALPGQVRRAEEPFGGAGTNAEVFPVPAQVINLGPEYRTQDVAKLCGVSRQTINQRVPRLVELGWLEERCTGRWSFDAEEAEIIRRNPRTRGPLKKNLAAR